MAQYPDVSVDVVELSSAVVGGASFFRHINFNLLERPNVRLRVDDGRNYLLTTSRRYDVITADIILPRHAGAGALYSREYFALVRRALNRGGLALQWNGAETDTTYRMILRTFMSAFPNTMLWADGTLMVGSLEPFENTERRTKNLLLLRGNWRRGRRAMVGCRSRSTPSAACPKPAGRHRRSDTIVARTAAIVGFTRRRFCVPRGTARLGAACYRRGRRGALPLEPRRSADSAYLVVFRDLTPSRVI